MKILWIFFGGGGGSSQNWTGFSCHINALRVKVQNRDSFLGWLEIRIYFWDA